MTARERRAITLGIAITVVALAVTYGVAPYARGWAARETAIAAKSDSLARFRALVRDAPRLAAAVRAREAALAGAPQRLIAARNAALAASDLQSVLQAYGAQSRVQVTRVDVAGDALTGALPTIPATIAATGDVYGLAELLALLERGTRLIEITDLVVQTIPGSGGDELLQFSIGVRAPFAALDTR
jgi:hypothetical protein